MKRQRRCTVVLAVVVIVLAGMGQARAETLDVTEFSGTFDQIDVPGDGSTFELLGGRITATLPDILPEQLTIADVIVDLSGYDTLGGGGVSIVSGGLSDILIIENPSNGRSAHLAVGSATLTQVLNDPIGVGFIELGLSLFSSNLETLAGGTINLNVVDALITMNGLVVTTDGSNGTASLGALSSASISAIPEPSTFLLALCAVVGCGGYRWRRRIRRFV